MYVRKVSNMCDDVKIATKMSIGQATPRRLNGHLDAAAIEYMQICAYIAV